MAIDLVTGAFGFTGSRIAQRLVAAGRTVRTISRRNPLGHPLATVVKQWPYDLSPAGLGRALEGVDTLYVTYWMRFPHGGETWSQIVDNVAAMARAAAEVGVRRLVYVSVSNAAHDASTAYFRAKARAEDAVRTAHAGYAIVRPTLLYGEGDILINNMAWTLRRLPVFGIPGDGRYLVQPVYVDDVAAACIDVARTEEQIELDARGPETLHMDELVGLVRAAVKSRALLTHLPVPLVLATTRVLGLWVRDVVLTRDEMRELMDGYLASGGPPTCPTVFSQWIARRGTEVGMRYSSELARNFRLTRPA